MEKYEVTGMSCAACQAHVEKAVRNVDGVTSCEVSLLTNSMTVEGTASPDKIIDAVTKAGYGASPVSSGPSDISLKEDPLQDKETPVLKKRLISSVLLLLILMYFSMGIPMFGFPSPALLKDNMLALGLIEMLLAGLIMVINQKFFISGIRGLIRLAPNMDSLVALGSGISFIYSFMTLLKMTSGTHDMAVMNDLYFESAAMIVTLITVGKLLESVSKGRTTDALKSLMKLSPSTAVILRNGIETTVDIKEVLVGDIFVVRPGDQIPVDGIVVEGISAVNESALTGESIPVDKKPDDKVSAGTVNQSGFIKCRATGVGEDTTLAQIIKLVSDSSSTKAPIARIADKISGIFVPATLVIAAVVTVIWLLTGSSLSTSLTRGIAVLVVSCPCALGLATPVAIMVGNGVGARNGILFKTSSALEQTGRIKTVVFDKTGTLTAGIPSVTDVFPSDGITESELLESAYCLEKKSNHPLGKAIADYAHDKDTTLNECHDFEEIPGKGVKATFNGQVIAGGNPVFISTLVTVPDDESSTIKRLSQEGKTPMLFACGSKLAGIIAVSDTIKDDAPKAIGELNKMGIDTVMLTGDNEFTAQAIGKQLGISQVIAGVLPSQKEETIRSLQAKGHVAMVGDGINDAPALTSADIGIAIGAGTDVAIDAADVVLMRSDVTSVPVAIELSRKTVRNIHENLFWAFIYNILLIPVAAGAYAWAGITMTPVLGALAMSISSFTVCMNALRLNLFKTETHKGDTNKMATTKTISIEGMMCGHCEKSVKTALEALPGVKSADVSHEKGLAVVVIEGNVSDEDLTKAVTAKDYKVNGIT